MVEKIVEIVMIPEIVETVSFHLSLDLVVIWMETEVKVNAVTPDSVKIQISPCSMNVMKK